MISSSSSRPYTEIEKRLPKRNQNRHNSNQTTEHGLYNYAHILGLVLNYSTTDIWAALTSLVDWLHVLDLRVGASAEDLDQRVFIRSQALKHTVRVQPLSSNIPKP